VDESVDLGDLERMALAEALFIEGLAARATSPAGTEGARA